MRYIRTPHSTWLISTHPDPCPLLRQERLLNRGASFFVVISWTSDSGLWLPRACLTIKRWFLFSHPTGWRRTTPQPPPFFGRPVAKLCLSPSQRQTDFPLLLAFPPVIFPFFPRPLNPFADLSEKLQMTRDAPPFHDVEKLPFPRPLTLHCVLSLNPFHPS